MSITNENYFSPNNNWKYCSASQFKDFFGCQGFLGCEARAMAKLKGDWKSEPSIAMVLGSYVDAHFEGTLDEFKGAHPEIFSKKGELLSQFKSANKMIERCERDEYFMKIMSGEKRKIFTAKLFDIEWKCKLDVYHPGTAIVDLKTVASVIDKSWNFDFSQKINFIEYYGYDLQLALYQAIVKKNAGDSLPCLIAAVSKETEPDIEVIGLDQEMLNTALLHFETMSPRLKQLKNNETEPIRCEHCDYCRNTKKLFKAKILLNGVFKHI